MHNVGILDLVGIGFGPAGVALAAAVHEMSEARGIDVSGRVAFFERSATPGWYPGLLFRNADIQHHYLRDLATPRDPRSRFTFANFLKEKDRIYEFGSLVYGGPGGAVSRIEWSDYVAWAAGLLDQYVTHACPVEELRLTHTAGEDVIAVRTSKGEVLTRSIAYCAGQDLAFPDAFHDHVGDQVFHATQFLGRIRDVPRTKPLRISVVGAGQAAIEIVSYLHTTYPEAQITVIQQSLGFHHGNHSPFIQRMFHAKESDIFFALEPEMRREVLREVARANYAAVDREAVSALYRTLYEDKILGVERVRFLTATEVTKVGRNADGSLRLTTRSRLATTQEDVPADLVVIATGFIDRPVPRLLEPLLPELQLNTLGEPDVQYDFSIKTRSESAPVIFIPGASEASHGLGAANSFSMIAVKAERVANAMFERGLLDRQRHQHAVA